tara:strand:+ start:319 stop:1446 length:1128 start_codon:yes stop_codon:yes gene_type:complete
MRVSFTNLIKASQFGDKNFNKKILKGINNLIKNNQFIGGQQVENFEKKFSKFIKIKNCITVANGTDALEIAIEALQLPKNSEVILPVNTWISTAEAVTRNGLKPVFCDVNLDNYSICIDDMKKKISKKTSAIIVVHLYGYPSDIKKIKKIISKKKIKLLEDCAQAHGTKISDKHVGTFGDISTFSFFPGKNLGAFGDAGAVVTNSTILAERCKRLKNHGALKKYDHKFVGRNSRLDSLQCFVLSTKIEKYNIKIRRRNLFAKIYLKKLKDIKGLYLPILDFKNNYNTFHQFVLRVSKKRDELIKFLNKSKIQTMIHYPYMLNDLKFYKNCKGINTLKNSKNLGKHILSLPISEEHSISEINYVCKKIKNFFNKKN